MKYLSLNISFIISIFLFFGFFFKVVVALFKDFLWFFHLFILRHWNQTFLILFWFWVKVKELLIEEIISIVDLLSNSVSSSILFFCFDFMGLKIETNLLFQRTILEFINHSSNDSLCSHCLLNHWSQFCFHKFRLRFDTFPHPFSWNIKLLLHFWLRICLSSNHWEFSLFYSLFHQFSLKHLLFSVFFKIHYC